MAADTTQRRDPDGLIRIPWVAAHPMVVAVDRDAPGGGWTDLGLGVPELRYIGDTEKQEVDFLAARGYTPVAGAMSDEHEGP